MPPAASALVHADFEAPERTTSQRITFIRPDRRVLGLDLAELWRFRSMVMLLVWRDFKVKYKQSALGAAAIIIQPFFSVILYSFVFGNLAKMDSEGRPYAIFNYVGMLPWILFSSALSSVSSSLVSNSHLIQKIHFPRALLPFYGAMTCVPDFLVQFVIQIGVLTCFGYFPTIHVIWLPLFVAWALLVSLSVGFAMSALTARFRDAAHAVTFLVQIWFYATPIVYSYKLMQGNVKYIGMLNPMTWVVNSFRWAILGTDDGPEPAMILPLVGTLAVLYVSYLFFRRTERALADVI